MTDFQKAPFSARDSGKHSQIDNDFPETARSGLTHLLFDLVEQKYVLGWQTIARELQRIGRLPPAEYNSLYSSHINQARTDSLEALSELSWDKCFDFCERLHSHLAQEVGNESSFSGYQVITPRCEVQSYIESALQVLFLEERLAYEFAEGIIRRRGRKHTVDVTTKAQVVLGDPKLLSARKHYEKSLNFFRHPSNPDFENAVKEAVCAVEAAGKTLFPESKSATLGDLTKWLSSSSDVKVPKAICNTISGIYAFRSGGEGIGHGGASGGTATLEVTEYVLAVCASQIIYFVDLSNSLEEEVPF